MEHCVQSKCSMFFKVPKRKYTLDRKDNPKRRKLTDSVESLNMVGHNLFQ